MLTDRGRPHIVLRLAELGDDLPRPRTQRPTTEAPDQAPRLPRTAIASTLQWLATDDRLGDILITPVVASRHEPRDCFRVGRGGLLECHSVTGCCSVELAPTALLDQSQTFGVCAAARTTGRVENCRTGAWLLVQLSEQPKRKPRAGAAGATLEKPALSAGFSRCCPIVSSGAASTLPHACWDFALWRSAAADGVRHAMPALRGALRANRRLMPPSFAGNQVRLQCVGRRPSLYRRGALSAHGGYLGPAVEMHVLNTKPGRARVLVSPASAAATCA